MAEDDEGDEGRTRDGAEDNSINRLLALSDGVFAIGMTLLALDLQLDVRRNPSAHDLEKALRAATPSYLVYLLSFFLVANYWRRHHTIMRSVIRTDRRLIERTLFILLLVAALPFPASLIGRYGGGGPYPLAIYGAYNLVLTLAVLSLHNIVQRDRLSEIPLDNAPRWEMAGNAVAFALCLPAAAFLPQGDGYWVLILLGIAGRLPRRAEQLDRLFRITTRAGAPDRP